MSSSTRRPVDAPAHSARSTQAPSTRFATALLAGFVSSGVRDVVVCPGARSQALALAAAALDAAGSVRMHVRIDERSAGFLALGLSLETGVPTIVITTSGTATANLHPAVLEADASGVPLLVLTADRPAELRGIRSNQTTVQSGLYGGAPRLSLDIDAPDESVDEADARALAVRAFDAALDDPGPVHLNLAFREPLSSATAPAEGSPDGSAPEASAPVGSAPDGSAPAQAVAARPAPRPSAHPVVALRSGADEPLTVVVAGNHAGERAEQVAREGGWPLLAEISSGARFGPQLVVAYRELLAEPEFGGRIERVVVFGHPTLSREVPALLRTPGIEVVVVSPHGDEFYDPSRTAVRASDVVVERAERALSRDERAWTGSWVFTSRGLLEARDPDVVDGIDEAADGRTMSTEDRRMFAKNSLAAIRAPITRESLVWSVWGVTWPHDRLVFGASRLIRVADGLLPGKKVTVRSSRGLAGIDGTVSTAVGVALASQVASTAGVTRLVVGDVTLLHDAGGLFMGAGEKRPRLQIVVGNDGGGTIFDGLEVAGTAPRDAFDRVQYTPQSVDLEALAAAYGWSYSRATTRGELDQALTSPGTGTSILEVPLTR